MVTEAIQVSNLSKRYFVTRSKAENIALWKRPVDNVRRLLGKSSRLTEEHWALNGIDFTVPEGEVLGIVGRNGSGKSTLLKILSRITDPTGGEARIRGRIASLLEVGTGFHPELTGRENIFLNGTIHGMSRAEIRSRLDEIIDFSGIEKFLDTPVKRYSSGMYVRLAFAVAAHLDSDILCLDEVLAVGDAEFRNKSMKKMHDVAHAGRTVLFVSHNLTAMATLCDSAMWLNQGVLEARGNVNTVLDQYLASGSFRSSDMRWEHDHCPGSNGIYLQRAWLSDAQGKVQDSFDISERFSVKFALQMTEELSDSAVAQFFLLTRDNACLLSSVVDADAVITPGTQSTVQLTLTVPANLLNTGFFRVSLIVASGRTSQEYIREEFVLGFSMTDRMHPDSVRSSLFSGVMPGYVRPALAWSLGDVETL